MELVYEQLLTQVDERSGVNRIVLNRPDRRNALNAMLVAELKDALALAEADDRVRVVGVSGAGTDFCAGADLREVQASIEEGALASLADAESLGELLLLLRRMEKPVVALVHGRALAGGCGLATACDLILASKDARFGYPEVKLGFVPAMVMAVLQRLVGEKVAFELIALGDVIDADEARRVGLVNRVYASDEFEERGEDFLVRLASRSASALALSKRLLYQIDGASFESAIRAGSQVNALARLTDDCQDGIRRFLEPD
jgi:methylglutaconyl-CoA hydratase